MKLANMVAALKTDNLQNCVPQRVRNGEILNYLNPGL